MEGLSKPVIAWYLAFMTQALVRRQYPELEDGESSWTTDEKWALGIAIGGGVALIAGAIYLIRSRGRQLGQIEDEVSAGGMKLVHHSDPTMSIQKRLKILQGLTFRSVKDPRNRKLALEMTQACPERDGLCEAEAIYKAIKGHVRYTGDVAPLKHDNGAVEGIDLYQSAYRTWEFGGGDCDCHAVLTASMLTLNGIPARFRLSAPRRDGEFGHIYTLAGVPKTKPTRWVVLDTTLPGYRFDVEAPHGRQADFPA